MLFAFILCASSLTAIFFRLLRNHLFSTSGLGPAAKHQCKNHMSEITWFHIIGPPPYVRRFLYQMIQETTTHLLFYHTSTGRSALHRGLIHRVGGLERSWKALGCFWGPLGISWVANSSKALFLMFVNDNLNDDCNSVCFSIDLDAFGVPTMQRTC